jgi:uroporphyrinogen-III synthase
MNKPVLMTAANSVLRLGLEPARFQLTPWPVLRLQAPNDSATLDEAISNLYGYDWIVFVNADAVRLFLERLDTRGHNVGDLDSLRVFSIGEEAADALSREQVHVDLIATQFTAASITEELKNFAGSDGALDRANFLIPQAAIGREYLKEPIEDTGARVDVVTAYQTVSPADLTRLSGLESMLRTASIDAVVFASAGDVHEFARVFDTNDIGRLARRTQVLTIDDESLAAVAFFGVSHARRISEPFTDAIAEILSPNAR